MKVVFTGKFTEYLLMLLGLTVLGILTFGIVWLYLPFWQMKYIVEHIEIIEKE